MDPVCSPRPFSSQSQSRHEAGPGADRERRSCSYDTNTTVILDTGHPGLQPSQRVVGDSTGGSLSGNLFSPSASHLMPRDWVHRRSGPGPGSSLPQLEYLVVTPPIQTVPGWAFTTKGEGHLTGGHKSFVKPAGHNTWRDDQPITVDEGSGTSTQHVIMIESADTGPGVKLERSEGEEDPRQSRDIQTEMAGVPPVAMQDPTTAPVQPRTRHSITEVSGTLNTVLKTETDTNTLTVTHRLLHTRSDHRSDPERLEPLGCPPASGSVYLPIFRQRTVHSFGDGDALDTGGNDPSCSYASEMDPGNMPLVLETQTDLSRGDWNRHSSSGYSEGCLDKKGEGLVVDEVTVKVEGDVPPTWNAANHLGDGHSRGRDFLDYRKSLETNPDVITHSPLHMLGDRDPVSTSRGPSDSHGHVLFDQAQGGGATSGNSKEKRFLCMFCNKGFSCLQKVEIHQRVHTGEKPFSCTQCHMRFTQAGHLKRHQMVHTGEKPYSCTQCHMRFAQAGDLKRHRRGHTGEKPFSCPLCENRFSERTYLRIHQQKKHSTQ